MKSRRVQYTVKPEYIALNVKNIQTVMESLRNNPIEGLFYTCFQLPDKASFMHVCMADSFETMEQLNAVQAFTLFRNSLKASEPLSPPIAEDMDFVGSSWDFVS